MRGYQRKLMLASFGLAIIGSTAFGLAIPLDPPPTRGAENSENPFIQRVRAEQPLDAKPMNRVARQDTSVALEWTGPATVKVNQPNDYTLAVTNTCGQPVQKVVVQVRLAKGANVAETSPEAKIIDGIYVWDLGTLEPKATRNLKLAMSQPSRGEVGTQAWVTSTGTSGMTVKVLEPKLSAEVMVPTKVALGDPIPVTYVVRNSGDSVVSNISATSGRNESKDQETTRVDSLEIGKDSKWVSQDRATVGGNQTYTVTAIGSDGTRATASASVYVMTPKLDIQIEGPTERIVGRKATYKVTLKNVGEIPLNDVQVQVPLPTGIRMVDRTGVLINQGTVSFGSEQNRLTLQPGSSSVLTFEAIPIQPGVYTLAANANGSHRTQAASNTRTVVEGIPAMRMEVVDLSDPVEKGGETIYEIRLTNTGTKSDSNVKLVCVLPKELEFVSATGPVGHQPINSREVAFEQINELAPKTEALFKVKVRATAVGDVRFKASITSKHLTTPVVKEESTRVYGD